MDIYIIVSGMWGKDIWGATTSFSEAMAIGEEVVEEECCTYVSIQKWSNSRLVEVISIPDED